MPGITVVTVTGLNVLGLDQQPLDGFVVFTASAPVDEPGANTVLEGAAVTEVVSGVMTPVTLPATDSVSPGFTYTITLRLQTADVSPPPVSGVLIPSSLAPTVDLSALLA